MARTHREVAIEEMLGTVEEAMHRVLNCWVDLPPPMKEAIERFRTQLGAAIDSVEYSTAAGPSWGVSGAGLSRALFAASLGVALKSLVKT